jgi:hypothetical protein
VGGTVQFDVAVVGETYSVGIENGAILKSFRHEGTGELDVF